MEEVVICRTCAQGWRGGEIGKRCPTGDGGVLIQQAVHEKFYSDEAIGRAVSGKYAIIDKLGEGGFGSVYRAIQEPVGRTVAVKVISSGQATDSELRGRFFREARVVSRLSNPTTVTLHDYGEDDDGTLFMVFEYIKGRLLSDIIAEGPMPPARAVALMQPVLSALTEAHEMGLIHRDLKPDNIMVSQSSSGREKVKVLDFGIAKMENPDDIDDVRTREGVVLGTPRYMSPEQSQDGELTGRSDLYAIGILLYEMTTGHPPFTGAVPFDILLAHIQKPVPPMPPSLRVPAAFEAVVRTALAKNPRDRFSDADAMSDALVQALGAGALPIHPPTGQHNPVTQSMQQTGQFAPLPATQNRTLVIILVLVILMAGTAGVWWFTRQTVKPTVYVQPPPVNVTVGPTDPDAQLAPILGLVAANRVGDAVLSMRRALENTGDREALIKRARSLPALAPVISDPSLQALLK